MDGGNLPAVIEKADGRELVPAVVAAAGGAAGFAWEEYFSAEIRNAHTRRAYRHAVRRFLAWAGARGLEDVQIFAGHADPRTTRLYDRRQRRVTRNMVERISIAIPLE